MPIKKYEELSKLLGGKQLKEASEVISFDNINSLLQVASSDNQELLEMPIIESLALEAFNEETKRLSTKRQVDRANKIRADFEAFNSGLKNLDDLGHRTINKYKPMVDINAIFKLTKGVNEKIFPDSYKSIFTYLSKLSLTKSGLSQDSDKDYEKFSKSRSLISIETGGLKAFKDTFKLLHTIIGAEDIKDPRPLKQTINSKTFSLPVVKTSNGSYMTFLKHLPDIHKSYDPAIGALFNLYSQMNDLVIKTPSNKKGIAFKRIAEGYRITSGRDYEGNDLTGSTFKVPKLPNGYKLSNKVMDNYKKLGDGSFIKSEHSLESIIANSIEALGSIRAKAGDLLPIMQSNSNAMRERAKTVYRDYILRQIDTLDISSFEGFRNTKIKDIKPLVRRDIATTFGLRKLNRDSREAVINYAKQALSFDEFDDLSVEDVLKFNPTDFTFATELLADRARVKGREKVAIKLAHLYEKHIKSNVSKETSEALMKHFIGDITSSFFDGSPTKKTFDLLDQLDTNLFDRANDGTLESLLKKTDAISMRKKFLATLRADATDKKDYSQFLDMYGNLDSKYLEIMIGSQLNHSNKAFGNKFRNEDFISFISNSLTEAQKETILEKGILFSDNLQKLPITKSWAKRSGALELVDKLIPEARNGKGIERSSWFAGGLTGSEYISQQFKGGEQEDFEELLHKIDDELKDKSLTKYSDDLLNPVIAKEHEDFSAGINKPVYAEDITDEVLKHYTEKSRGSRQVNLEAVKALFQTTTTPDGIVGSVIQQLNAKQGELSFDDIKALQSLASSLGFVRKNDAITSRKELNRVMNYLLRLQTEINSRRDLRKVGTQVHRSMQIPLAVKAAMAGEALPDDSDAKSHKVSYMGPADLLSKYKRLHMVTKTLFGDDLDTVDDNNLFKQGVVKSLALWESKINDLQNNVSDGKLNSKLNFTFGSGITSLEERLLTGLKPYIQAKGDIGIGYHEGGKYLEHGKYRLLSTDKETLFDKSDLIDVIDLSRTLSPLYESFFASMFPNKDKIYPTLTNTAIVGTKNNPLGREITAAEGINAFLEGNGKRILETDKLKLKKQSLDFILAKLGNTENIDKHLDSNFHSIVAEGAFKRYVKDPSKIIKNSALQSYVSLFKIQHGLDGDSQLQILKGLSETTGPLAKLFSKKSGDFEEGFKELFGYEYNKDTIDDLFKSSLKYSKNWQPFNINEIAEVILSKGNKQTYTNTPEYKQIKHNIDTAGLALYIKDFEQYLGQEPSVNDKKYYSKMANREAAARRRAVLAQQLAMFRGYSNSFKPNVGDTPEENLNALVSIYGDRSLDKLSTKYISSISLTSGVKPSKQVVDNKFFPNQDLNKASYDAIGNFNTPSISLIYKYFKDSKDSVIELEAKLDRAKSIYEAKNNPNSPHRDYFLELANSSGVSLDDYLKRISMENYDYYKLFDPSIISLNSETAINKKRPRVARPADLDSEFYTQEVLRSLKFSSNTIDEDSIEFDKLRVAIANKKFPNQPHSFSFFKAEEPSKSLQDKAYIYNSGVGTEFKADDDSYLNKLYRFNATSKDPSARNPQKFSNHTGEVNPIVPPTTNLHDALVLSDYWLKDFDFGSKEYLSLIGKDNFKNRSLDSQVKILSRLFKLKKFASGGYLPGKSIKDEVPALLMKGEAVINQDAVQGLGINSHEDFNRFQNAAKQGKVKGFSTGGGLFDPEELNSAIENASTKDFLKGLKDAKLTFGEYIKEHVSSLDDSTKLSRSAMIKTALRNQNLVLSLNDDELGNLLKNGVMLSGADASKINPLIDSLLKRSEGSNAKFTSEELNTFTGLSKIERLNFEKLMSNPRMSDAFNSLSQQSKRFTEAKSFYIENGLELDSNSAVPETSLFTTGANIENTVKTLKKIYNNKELAEKLGLDVSKMMSGIADTEQDFVNAYINDKDKLKRNILDPLVNNKTVAQSRLGKLTDEELISGQSINKGLNDIADDIDPDGGNYSDSVKAKTSRNTASINAAAEMRNRVNTRWANFSEQVLQNGAFMAGSAAVAIPISVGAAIASHTLVFQDRLKNLQAITGSSTQQLDSMAESIKNVAVNTKFSAVEISEAATTLGQAGFSTTDINESLSGIVKLATATGSSLEESTQTLTSALTVWDRALSDSDSIANEMTASINKSKLDMRSISSALQYTGNIAAQGGIPITDILTMTSLMKDAGIKQPSTIATGSRLVYSDFIAPSKKFVKSLKMADIALEEFQATFDSGGVIEAVKFLKRKGYGFSEAAVGMEVRERSAFMGMLNQIDKADAFKASITGTSAADKANDIQMESGINIFKNMANSWQLAIYDGNKGLLEGVSKLAKLATLNQPESNKDLFRKNSEIGTNYKDQSLNFANYASSLAIGVGTYYGAKKFLNAGNFDDMMTFDKLKAAKGSLKTFTPGIFDALFSVMDGYSEASTRDSMLAGAIKTTGELAKQVIPSLGSVAGATFGAPSGPGAIATGIAGYIAGDQFQKALGVDTIVDNATESLLNAFTGVKGKTFLEGRTALSEEQNALITNLTKTIKTTEDNKSLKVLPTDTPQQRDAKEQAVYKEALELNRKYYKPLAMANIDRTFTDGVYGSYVATGGKKDSKTKLIENQKSLLDEIAIKVAESQLEKLPEFLSTELDTGALDKLKGKADFNKYMSTTFMETFEKLVASSPLTYQKNKEAINAYLDKSAKAAYSYKGYSSTEAQEFSSKHIKQLEGYANSDSFSSMPREMLNNILRNTEKGSAVYNNALRAAQNDELESSGYNKFRDKIQDIEETSKEINKDAKKFLNQVVPNANDISFNAVKALGAEGYSNASIIGKSFVDSLSKFNNEDTQTLLRPLLGKRLTQSYIYGKDLADDSQVVGKLASKGEASINIFDNAVNASDKLAAALIAASNSAEQFSNGQTLTKTGSTKEGDWIDYQFNKALKGELVNRGLNVGSIDKALTTDIFSLSQSGRLGLKDLFNEDFKKKIDLQKKLALEDIDYNINKNIEQAYRQKSNNTEITNLQQSFQASNIERNRQHSLEEASINYSRQIDSIGRQRIYAVQGASRNLAQNLYQIGVNFTRNMEKLNTDNARSIAKITLDTTRSLEKLDLDKTRSIAQANLSYSRGVQDLGTNRTRSIEDTTTNLSRALEDLTTSVSRAQKKLELDTSRNTTDAQTSFARQVASIQQAMADTNYMFERSLSKPVNIKLDPEALLKVANNLDNLSLAMDAHKAALTQNTSAVQQYLGINQSKEQLVKNAYIEAYKASGGDTSSDVFKTAYTEYMKSNGSQLVDSVLGYGIDTALAGDFDTTRALTDAEYVANTVANPSEATTTEEAIANTGLTTDELVNALLGNGKGEFTIQTTQGVVLQAQGEMESALFDLETQMINFGFSLRDASTSLSYALSDIQLAYNRSLDDILVSQSQQTEDLLTNFSRSLDDIDLAYSRGLDDLNLSLSRSLQDIAIQYQYSLEDLRLSNSYAMADLQTSFSQALEDLRRDTEWSRQDALVNFQFALQDIQAQYNQSLNEAAINYENQINDINRNAAWQLSETFINNEQNKQVMELQFSQLLNNINISSDEAKANLERQIGNQLATVVLDLQGFTNSFERQFRASLANQVFDMSIVMAKFQEGLNKSASEVEVNFDDLRNKLTTAISSLQNDEQINSTIDRLGVSFSDLSKIIEEGGDGVSKALDDWKKQIEDYVGTSSTLQTKVQQAQQNFTQMESSMDANASSMDSVAESTEDAVDSATTAASEAVTLSSKVSQSTTTTISAGQQVMSSSAQIAVSVATAAAQIQAAFAQAQSMLANLRAQAAASANTGNNFSIGTVLPGYGGGDIIPAMLEPGEAVVTKEAVRALGPNFFNKLNASDLEGAFSGLETSKVYIDKSQSQSATSAMAGYNINIQVAPDASLTTIERNIDKIAKGVRQVFEEYL